MKLIKKIFKLIVVLLMILCIGIVVCAFNPSLTASLADRINSVKKLDVVGSVDSPSGSTELNSVYEPPADITVDIPEAVKGKNGYEPISDKTQEIDDESANEILEQLDNGKTGAELSFDGLFYPYYAMLEEKEQSLYKQIYANAMDVNDTFSPVEEININDVKRVFEAVYNDHPEIFWMETGYSCKYQASGICVEITMEYNSTATGLEEEKIIFDNAANDIIIPAMQLSSVEEKEKYVHDALVEKVTYNSNAPMNQSAYSALVEGQSVCAGYARAFQYIMMKMEIPCYYCTGYSGESHAWNILKQAGGYTNVDVTWDDTEPATYDFYNKTDDEYKGTHVRSGMSVKLPPCLAMDDLEAALDSEDSSGEDGTTEYPLINPNPIKPMTLESELVNEMGNGSADNGIIDNIDEYYQDCYKQLVELGKGQKQYENLIPEDMWSKIEEVYGNGEFKTGYINSALKELGAENYSIQIKADRLGNGYYRLVHNISTW